MNANETLIHQFYTCFKNKDYKGMQACYAPNAVFNDAVFKNLNSGQVKAMWQMLLTKGKDLSVEFNEVRVHGNEGSAHWDANYTFSATGNKVHNAINANFEFENGKILKHTDTFDFYRWAKQALGLKGLLLGWTPLLRQKVREQAMKNLNAFMATSNLDKDVGV